MAELYPADGAADDYRGVVLQATYRITQGVPVVYLFGRLSDERTFVVRDSRQVPHFYIAAADAHHVLRARVEDSSFCNFSGQSLARVNVSIPSDAPVVRDSLHQLGVVTYEADVRFAMRYLIDRGIKGGIHIRGVPTQGVGTDLAFDNPRVGPADARITPRVLSFDIETNPDTDQLLAIACYGCGVDTVFVVDPSQRDMPANAVGVGSEAQALQYFAELVQQLDPDVLTGWNVIDFDLVQLLKFAQRLKVNFALGREPGKINIRPAQGYFGSGHASIPGRLVLDGADLVRGAFIKLDSYSLQGAAQAILGEGKTLGQDGRDKVSEILRTYREDLHSFCLYARTDARLVIDILNQLNLVELAFARSRLTGMPPDRVSASIASFDFLYLHELGKQQIAAPTVVASSRGAGPQSGGAVFEPQVGIHRNVWVFDFKSLYPSVIRTYNIDPLGYVRGQNEANPIVTDSGARFSRQPGILKSMLDNLFPTRAAAKAAGDEVASQAIKILMNSCYGVLGTPACRFYNPALANAITGQGRYLLSWSKQWFEDQGYTVLYGDTDSVFVASNLTDGAAADALGAQLVQQFNAALAAHITQTIDEPSYLELEFEKLYSKLFLAKVRGGNQGARKRYAGLRHGASEPEFVGMEVVRRDWTDLAKTVQRELFARLFDDHTTGAELAAYIADVVAQVRAGHCDDQLVYRRGLRKSVDEYVTNVPPHVQAVKKALAQQQLRTQPRVVRYVMTVSGPELLELHTSSAAALDREYYVQRQVLPVAEPLLDIFGLNFAKVIGDDRQTDLFA